jgi:urea ABC transporter urea binding protein
VAGRTVDRTSIEDALARVLQSDVFQRSPQARRFLEYVVTERLAGQAESLKAYTIGVAALGANGTRSAPETTARMQASRVRRLLDRYYRTLGQADPVTIELPPGSYEARFAFRDKAAPDSSAHPGRVALLVEDFDVLSEWSADDSFSRALVQRIVTLLVHEDALILSGQGAQLARDAAFVLGGSLIRNGESVRVVASLRSADGATVWAEQYDRSLSQERLLEVEDELALGLAARVGDPVVGALARAVRGRSASGCLDPVQSFYRFLAGPSGQSLAVLKVELEKALSQADERAALHAAYSCVLSLVELGQGSSVGSNQGLSAEVHARTAVALDAQCALGRMARAFVHFRRGEVGSVLREAELALALSPASVTGHAIVGHLLLLSGHWETGLAWVSEAAGKGLHLPNYLALGPCLDRLVRAADPAAALEEAERLEAPLWLVQLLRAACLGDLGRTVEARRAFARALSAEGGTEKRLERKAAEVFRDAPTQSTIWHLASGGGGSGEAEVPKGRASYRAPRLGRGQGGAIKVGILQSLSGPMAICETHMVSAAMLAIEEINAQGGLFGRSVHAVVEDGASDPEVFRRAAHKLVETDRVAAVFGCWTSSSRKAVLPVVEQADRLLWYPVQYEGLERSRHVIYTGSCLNQQIEPALRWALREGHRRVTLVGSDYVFPRTANRLIRGVVEAAGGSIDGEFYVPLGRGQFEEIAHHVRDTRPDLVLSTVNGADNLALFRALAHAGVRADAIPVLSFSLSELELSKAPELMAGHLACWSYFQSIDHADNRALVQRFRSRYGEAEVLSDPTVTAHAQVHLWKDVAARARSLDSVALLAALPGCQLSLGGQLLTVSENHHVTRPAVIGRATSRAEFEIVWRSRESIQPRPWLGVEEADFLARDLVLEALRALPEMADKDASPQRRLGPPG